MQHSNWLPCHMILAVCDWSTNMILKCFRCKQFSFVFCVIQLFSVYVTDLTLDNAIYLWYTITVTQK